MENVKIYIDSFVSETVPEHKGKLEFESEKGLVSNVVVIIPVI